MARVKFLQDHRCSPDGATVREFKKGEICADMRDSLAEALSGSMRIAEIVGPEVEADKPAAAKPATKARAGAPANK